MSSEEPIKRLEQTIIDGDEEGARCAAQEILNADIDPMEAILQGAARGLDVVGDRYQRLEAFLPELVGAGEAMKACMEILTPHVSQDQAKALSPGKVVLGTVSGDIHDIGKNLVATMLMVKGFDVYDVGVDVPVRQFVQKAEEVKANVIALSALLTQTAYYQKEVIKYLRDAGLREKYYVVVGGAPITAEWAAEIGADGYGKTAVSATELVRRLITEGVPPPLAKPLVVE